jgi:hypothetical protein
MTDRTASVATCVIDGHEVVFRAWRDAAAAAGPMTVALPSVEADGETWSATLVNDGASLLVQRRIATKVAKALGGTVSVTRG